MRARKTFNEHFKERLGKGEQTERDMLADWAAEREKFIGALRYYAADAAWAYSSPDKARAVLEEVGE